MNAKEVSSQDLWQYVKPEIPRIEQSSRGVIILDNNIEEKTYTDKSKIICWYYSHAKGRSVKGVNLMSCLVRYGEIALSIVCEVVQDINFSDKDFCLTH